MYLILSLVFAVCVLGSWASFTDGVRRSPWFIPLMVCVSVTTGFLFAYGCRMLDSKPRIFVFSLYYDVMMASAYYVIPLAFFGCHVRPAILVGAAFVVLGLVVIHFGE